MTAVARPSNRAPHSEQTCWRAASRRSRSATTSSAERCDTGDGMPRCARCLCAFREAAARARLAEVLRDRAVEFGATELQRLDREVDVSGDGRDLALRVAVDVALGRFRAFRGLHRGAGAGLKTWNQNFLHALRQGLEPEGRCERRLGAGCAVDLAPDEVRA